MARINIEECWWSDPRRSRLIKLIGSEERADGIAVKMWRVGQEFWKRDRQLVPIAIFDSLEFAQQLLGAGLAVIQGDFVYIRGSSQYLEWVHDKQEAGRIGGKKSAERPRDEKGRLLPKDQTNTEQTPNNIQADSKQIQASDSVSGSKELNTIEQRKRRSNVKSQFDLEKLYEGYPRKKGKTPGLKKLSKDILSIEDYEQLAAAIQNYAQEVAGKEPQYILHFSTFAGQWRDWVHVEPDQTQFSINTKPISLEES